MGRRGVSAWDVFGSLLFVNPFSIMVVALLGFVLLLLAGLFKGVFIAGFLALLAFGSFAAAFFTSAVKKQDKLIVGLVVPSVIVMLFLTGLASSGFLSTGSFTFKPVFNKEDVLATQLGQNVKWIDDVRGPATSTSSPYFPFFKGFTLFNCRTNKDFYTPEDAYIYLQCTGYGNADWAGWQGDWMWQNWTVARNRGSTDASPSPGTTGCTSGVTGIDTGVFLNNGSTDYAHDVPDSRIIFQGATVPTSSNDPQVIDEYRRFFTDAYKEEINNPTGFQLPFTNTSTLNQYFRGAVSVLRIPRTAFKEGRNTLQFKQDVGGIISCRFKEGLSYQQIVNVDVVPPRRWVDIDGGQLNVFLDSSAPSVAPQPIGTAPNPGSSAPIPSPEINLAYVGLGGVILLVMAVFAYLKLKKN